MKIVFLNVWGDHVQDSLVPYLEEHAKDTDIFCFQEATDNMKLRCKAAFTDFIESSDYKYISDNEYFPMSIYTNKNMQVLSSGTLMADGMDRGLAMYVEIKTQHGSMFVCNVHGRSRPNEKLDNPGRLMQSRDIIDFFKNKLEPVIIGGDFNLFPETESIQMFKKQGYRDLIEEFGIDTTRNHLVWDRYPIKMLYSDYVFLNDKVVLKSFSVPKNEVSDHLPLILEIQN